MGVARWVRKLCRLGSQGPCPDLRHRCRESAKLAHLKLFLLASFSCGADAERRYGSRAESQECSWAALAPANLPRRKPCGVAGHCIALIASGPLPGRVPPGCARWVSIRFRGHHARVLSAIDSLKRKARQDQAVELTDDSGAEKLSRHRFRPGEAVLNPIVPVDPAFVH